MFVAAQGKAAAGGSEVLFDQLRVPSGGPLPKAADRFRARLVDLVARPSNSDLAYAVEMRVQFKDHGERHVGGLRDPYAANTTHRLLKPKLDGYLTRLPEMFPDMAHLPTATLDEVTAGLVWSLTLPPFTSLAASDYAFFPALGFDDADLVTTNTGRVGLSNKTPTAVTYRSSDRPVNEKLPIVRLLHLQDQDMGEPAPQNVTLETHFHADWLPQTLHSAKPLTATDAAESLGMLVDSGLGILNLKPGALSVAAETGTKVVLLNEAQPQSRVTLELAFPDPVARFLGTTADEVHAFPFIKKRRLVLTTKPHQVEKDPLAPFLPLTVLCTDEHGAGNSWVQGHGWSSVLAVMHGQHSFHEGAGLVLRGDSLQLRLALLDRTHTRVVFGEDTDFFLTLDVKPLSF